MMKKIPVLLWLALSICFVQACQESKSTDTEVVDTDIIQDKSEVYKETVKNATGDFAQFSIDMSYDKAKTILDKNYLSTEEEDFLQYKVSKDFSISEYSLVFEDDKLTQIAFDTEIFNEVDENDWDAALVFFKELKDDFMTKFGGKYLENNNGNSAILFWTKDNKEIQLIQDASEVHVYIDKIELDD